MSAEPSRAGVVFERVRGARGSGVVLGVLFACVVCPVAAHDGGTSLPTHIDVDELPNAIGADDPLAGGEESRAVEQAAAAYAAQDEEDRRRYAPRSPNIAPVIGASLTAISGVREEDHAIAIRLSAGLALVEETMVFSSIAETPAEIQAVLAMPEDAVLASMRVCNARGCRDGAIAGPSDRFAYDDAVRARPSSGPAAPVAFASIARAGVEQSWTLLAAPVRRDAPLTIRCVWIAASAMHGGVVRFRIPPRGSDGRASAVSVRITTPGLLSPSLNGALWNEGAADLDPWNPIEVSATVPASPAWVATSHAVPCPRTDPARRAPRGRTCVRRFTFAAPRPAPAIDLILAIDRSRSTEGPASGRLPFALASILAQTPPGSSVRAIAFASRTEVLVAGPTAPDRVSLDALASVTETDLGASTRFEAVWATARGWIRSGRKTAIVIIGDGALTAGPRADAAFQEARRLGVEISSVNVDDRQTQAIVARGVSRTGGVSIDAGGLADRAMRADERPLEERVSALFAPKFMPRGRGQIHAALRAGEAMATIDVAARTGGRSDDVSRAVRAYADPARTEASSWIAIDRGTPAASCSDRGPPSRPDGASSDAAPIALAEPRRCAPVLVQPLPDGPGAGRDRLVPETIQFFVRQRIVPPARACFRADRRGRGDYAVRATFYFALADREVIAADVRGAISERLRTCLLDTIDALEIPRFSGVIAVNYPLRTERVEAPPTISFGADMGEALDAVIGTSVRPNDVLRLAGPRGGD